MSASGAFFDTLNGGDGPIRYHRISRLLAATAAVAFNALLLLALMATPHGSRHFQSEQTLLMVDFGNAATAHAPDVVSPPPVHHHRAQVMHVGLEVSPGKGPPTESAEYLASNSSADRDAIVDDAPALRQLCLRAYPVELTSELATSAEIGLRVFVMPDGRIGQGAVVDSSGDERLDFLTLKCLQANGHLEAQSDSSAPNGSWQHLTWFWALP